MSLRSRLLVLLLAAACAGAAAPAGSAHAILERSSPGDGSRVAHSPTELRLWFSEEISSRFREVRVVDGAGRIVQGAIVTGDGGQVVVQLPRLGSGTYGVLWRVLSENDSHVTGGSIAFGVGAGPAVAAPASPRGGAAFSWLEALFRWLDFSLLAGVVGCLVVATFVLPRSRVRDGRTQAALAVARRRVLRAGIWCAFLAVGAGVARLAWQSHELTTNLGAGTSWAANVVELALQSRWGWMWLVRELALFAVAGVLLSLRSGDGVDVPASRGRVSVAGVLLVVAGAAHAMTSHAAALEPASPAAVVGDTVHVLAAATWLGGVAALALALWPARGLGRSEASALARACRRPFAAVAGLSVGLVVVTGLYSAGRQVASIDALFTTSYGHVLMIKTGLVFLVLGFGALNFTLLRSLGRRGGSGASRFAGSRRAILPEVILGAGAFLAAAVLASSVPARGPEFAPPRPAVATERSASAADLVVTVSGTPTRVGSNAFNVLVASSRRPPPAPLSGVTLEIRNGTTSVQTIPLQTVEPNRYFGTAVLGEPGQSEFAVVVDRGGERFEVPFEWSIAPADPARPITFSSRPLAPILDAMVVFLLALALAAGAWALTRRARPAGGLVGSVQERVR